MKRPILFLAFSFLFGTTVYVASHVVAESRAAAAGMEVQQPDQQKPAPLAVKQEPAREQHKHVEEGTRPELMARHAESAREAIKTEQAHERGRRQELCRKLEQRRQELRHEQQAKPREATK